MIDGRAVSRRPSPVEVLSRLLRDQRVKFVIAGSINTAFGFACFATFETLLGDVTGYMLVLLLAHVSSVLFAFTVHRRFVFRVTGSVWRDLWRFESVNLTSLGINALLLPICVEVGSLPVLVAQALVTCVIAVVSWLGHSRFSFYRKAVNP
jgi:putative flippase GtrA